MGVNYNLLLIEIRESKSVYNLHSKNGNANEDKSLCSVEWSTKILSSTLLLTRFGGGKN